MINKKKIAISPVFYILYTFILISFLRINPFGTIFRGILYGSIPVLGLITLMSNLKERKIIKAPISYIAIIYNIYVLVMVIMHGEFMMHGFVAINNLLFCCIILYENSSDEIFSQLISIARFAVVFVLAFSVGSLIVDTLIEKTSIMEILHSKGIIFLDSKISTGGRLTGLAENSNSTGGICAYGIICGIFCFIFDKKIVYKVISALSILSSIAVIILASSRTSVMVVVVFSAIFFIAMLIYCSKKDRECFKILLYLILFLVVSCLVFLGCIFLFADDPIDYILNDLIRVGSLKSATGRYDIHKKIVEVIKEHPLFGVSYQQIYKVLDAETNAHQAYLQVFANTGIVGFLLFVGMWVSVVYLNIRTLFDKRITKTEFYLSIFTLSVVIAALLRGFYETILFLDFIFPQYLVYYCAFVSCVIYNNIKRRAENEVI